MTAAGDLTDRLRFEQRGEDDNGDRLGDWDADSSFTRSARLFFRQGTEPVIEQRLQGVQPVEITVRADPDTRQITNAWRAVAVDNGTVAADTVFNLKAITPGSDRAWITILGTVGGSDA